MNIYGQMKSQLFPQDKRKDTLVLVVGDFDFGSQIGQNLDGFT